MAWPTAAARTKTWGTEILTASDLQGQFDLGFTYFNDSLNGSTGHGHTGGSNDGPKITLTTGVTGTLPLANGGTGQASLSALLNLVYPVGSIYGNRTVSTNPATLLGFGTWVAIGGFVAGLDGTTEFLTAGQTGGAKTVTLTAAQSGLPAHTHTYAVELTAGGGSTNAAVNAASNTFTQLTTGSTGGTSAASSHSILPPYTVVYLWYRSV